jgi:hypothetical protein
MHPPLQTLALQQQVVLLELQFMTIGVELLPQVNGMTTKGLWPFFPELQ